MKSLSIFVSGILVLISCGDAINNDTKSPSDIKIFSSDDQLMNSAIEKARLTFSEFDTAFKNGNFNTSEFSLKVRFETESGGEHIWTHGVTFENNSYYGIIDEDAIATDKIKMGDKVKVTMENLSDWVYGDKGILRGGFTIKVLRSQMTIDERKKFDSTYYLKIID